MDCDEDCVESTASDSVALPFPATKTVHVAVSVIGVGVSVTTEVIVRNVVEASAIVMPDIVVP